MKIVRISVSEFDNKAAEYFIDILKKNNIFSIALPTGNTPLGMYQELKRKKFDWSKIKIFMLDANYPQDPKEPSSFFSFAKDNLGTARFNILDSQTTDSEKECQTYEEKIKTAGGLDLAVLGIGENSHIAYNEPGTDPELLTHLVKLSKETVGINNLKNNYGLTMGIKTIMSARKILVLAKGTSKAKVIKAAIEGPVSIDCPASVLQNHPNTTYLIDYDAAGLLSNH